MEEQQNDTERILNSVDKVISSAKKEAIETIEGLNKMLGFDTESQELSDEQYSIKQTLEAIELQVKVMAAFSFGFIGYIKYEQGLLKLKPCDIEEIMNGALFEAQIASGTPPNIELYIDIEENFPKMMIDYIAVKELLKHLIMNAIEAMEPIRGKLMIQVKREDKFALIDVTDTGFGILPESQKNIFGSIGSPKWGRTGFGLPTCKKIAQAHNGDITLTSQVNKGTTFTVKLPLS